METDQCKRSRQVRTSITLDLCTADISGTIDANTNINNDKLDDLYSDSVLAGQMESIRIQYNNCLRETEAFMSANGDDLVEEWQS